jgi:nucleoside-diphosphate-sugar epimerase
MIVGNGDIASVLKDRDGFIFFASGVSNSQETRESEFQREKDLLLSQDKSKHLVYFGSLCVFYAKTRYAQHKMEMERLIKENFKSWTIMRLGNITWGTNPNTIINFFRNKIARRESIEIQNTFRYVVDLGDFLHWLSMIPKWNCEMNITGRRMSIRQIVEELV